MKNLFLLFLLPVFFGCNRTPEPIRYGREACYSCKMTMMDPRFGAEIVSTTGKVFKFDDVICMIRFLASGKIKETDVVKKLVIDYLHKNNFLDATQAVYFVGDDMHSPMNGSVGAFAAKQEATDLLHAKQGAFMDWNRLYNQLK